MPSVLRSLSALLPAASLFLCGPVSAQTVNEDNFLTRTEKSVKRTVSRTTFQIRDKLDFCSVPRTRAAIEETQECRLLKAKAAGKFVDEHFTNKIVVPVFFNCPDDPLEEEELKEFLEQAVSVKIAGPVYITIADGALPIPEEHPTADQLNEALLRGIELRADVIVVFMGLPLSRKERESLVCRQWTENAPRLIFTEVTDSFFLKRTMFPCPVAAAILPRTVPLEPEKRPWYEFLFFWKDAPPEPDPFDLRYILLSDENADELIAQGTVFLKPVETDAAGSAGSVPELDPFSGSTLKRPRRVSPVFPEDFTQAYRELFRYDRVSAIDSFERYSREMKK